MNIELLSTFQQNYPEEFDGTLDCASMAVCCAFNKIGNFVSTHTYIQKENVRLEESFFFFFFSFFIK